jgi:hypothetical protein
MQLREIKKEHAYNKINKSTHYILLITVGSLLRDKVKKRREKSTATSNTFYDIKIIIS